MDNNNSNDSKNSSEQDTTPTQKMSQRSFDDESMYSLGNFNNNDNNNNYDEYNDDEETARPSSSRLVAKIDLQSNRELNLEQSTNDFSVFSEPNANTMTTGSKSLSELYSTANSSRDSGDNNNVAMQRRLRAHQRRVNARNSNIQPESINNNPWMTTKKSSSSDESEKKKPSSYNYSKTINREKEDLALKNQAKMAPKVMQASLRTSNIATPEFETVLTTTTTTTAAASSSKPGDFASNQNDNRKNTLTNRVNRRSPRRNTRTGHDKGKAISSRQNFQQQMEASMEQENRRQNINQFHSQDELDEKRKATMILDLTANSPDDMSVGSDGYDHCPLTILSKPDDPPPISGASAGKMESTETQVAYNSARASGTHTMFPSVDTDTNDVKKPRSDRIISYDGVVRPVYPKSMQHGVQLPTRQQSSRPETSGDHYDRRAFVPPRGAFSVSASRIEPRSRGVLSLQPRVETGNPDSDIEQRASPQTVDDSVAETAVSRGVPETMSEHSNVDGSDVDFVPQPIPSSSQDPALDQAPKIDSESIRPIPRSYLCTCFTILVIILITVVLVLVLPGSSEPEALSDPIGDDVPIVDPMREILIKQLTVDIISSKEKIEGINTPQSLAHQWLLSDNMLSPISSESTYQEEQRLITRYILAVFYYSLIGSSWVSSNGWLESETSECSWQYITCDNNTQVISIDTGGAYKNLRGAIPSELKHLLSLRELVLASNDIGTIDDLSLPSSLVVLDLSDNAFTGNIPLFIYDLTNLEILSLSSNSFEGKLDEAIDNLFNLRELQISKNDLSGTITSYFGNLTLLEKIDLGTNSFEGELHGMFEGLTNLESINIPNNDFTGSIGTHILTMTGLRILSFPRNSISGSIPTELGLLSSSLAFLEISTNDLEGSLPSELGSLTNLVRLQAHDNKLTGSIPSEIGMMTLMAQLNLHKNRELNGQIPSEIALLSQLTTLELYDNLFSGTIPSGLGLVTSLRRLNLINNRLEGQIPSELGNLSMLSTFRVGGNDLSGTFPAEMCTLNFDSSLTQGLQIPCDVTCGCQACVGRCI